MARKTVQPETAEDVQARTTLLAARDVAATIEQIRTRLRSPDLATRTRIRLKDGLLEAAERLVNLLELLASRADRLSKHVRPVVVDGIGELRGKLVATGLRLVGDKVERIHDRAVGVTERGEECALGLSTKLSEELGAVEATVEALGGKAALPPELDDKLERTEKAVDGLHRIERAHGMLRELEAKK